MTPVIAIEPLQEALQARGDPSFADRLQRYFPDRVDAFGVSNAAVSEIAADFLRDRPDLDPQMRLALADDLLAAATRHEEVLVAFALLHRVAKKGLGEELLERSQVWLEEWVTNWAQCDDLCLKLLYPYFLGHLDSLPQTRRWVDSPFPWARRAANVAVVKFVHRTVGRRLFQLPTAHVFDNCTRLMHDEDMYVQKGCGWLLKVTAQVHPHEVSAFLSRWQADRKRDTFRYAVEKMDAADRTRLMVLNGGLTR